MFALLLDFCHKTSSAMDYHTINCYEKKNHSLKFQWLSEQVSVGFSSFGFFLSRSIMQRLKIRYQNDIFHLTSSGWSAQDKFVAMFLTKRDSHKYDKNDIHRMYCGFRPLPNLTDISEDLSTENQCRLIFKGLMSS